AVVEAIGVGCVDGRDACAECRVQHVYRAPFVAIRRSRQAHTSEHDTGPSGRDRRRHSLIIQSTLLFTFYFSTFYFRPGTGTPIPPATMESSSCSRLLNRGQFS